MLPEGVRRFFRLGRVKDVEAEVDAELAFHIDTKTEALVASGMRPEAARTEALRQFGDVRVAREDLARLDSSDATTRVRRERLADLWIDVRYALRGFRRAPAIPVAILIMLGLGIGGASAMYGLLDRLLLRVGPDIAAPDQLRRIYVKHADRWSGRPSAYSSSFSEPQLRAFAAALQETGITATSMNEAVIRPGGMKVAVTMMTGGGYRVLGARPYAGRTIEPTDDAPGAPPVVMLSYELWRRLFRGRADALGQEILLGKTRYTVVGVAPPGFSGLYPDRVDVWVALVPFAEATYWPGWRRSMYVFEAVVRVSTPADSQSVALALRRAYLASARMENDSNAAIHLGPITPGRRLGSMNERAKLPLIVAGVAAILCVIAVANVVNLLMLRAAQRRHETAVRAALGAGRFRLIRSTIVESVLLAAGGAVASLAVAAWGGDLLRKLVVRQDWQRGIMDVRVAAFAAGLGLVIGLVSGLVPGWLGSGGDATAALKSGTRVAEARSRLRFGLLVLQASLTVMLVAGLGLYVRSFLKVRAVDYGVAADRLLNVSVSTPPADSSGRAAEMTSELSARVRAIPGVAAVSEATMAPVYGYGAALLRAEGLDTVHMNQFGPFITEIDSLYLSVTGLRVLRGRSFTQEEVATSAPVALVNDAMARRLWPQDEALGKCLYIGFKTERSSALCRRVVGIVSHYRNRLREEAPMQNYYIPLGYHWNGRSAHSLVVRATGSPERLAPDLLRALRRSLPEAEPGDIFALTRALDGDRAPWRAGTTLFLLFAVLAVILATFGLYSVVAYSVLQRNHEFGIRIAVGARAPDLVRLVAATALAPVSAGLLAGMGLTVWAVRFLEPLLYETESRDPLALGGAVVALVVLAFLACAGPARRAARTDPREALQAE